VLGCGHGILKMQLEQKAKEVADAMRNDVPKP
jgi:hypothetical protein